MGIKKFSVKVVYNTKSKESFRWNKSSSFYKETLKSFIYENGKLTNKREIVTMELGKKFRNIYVFIILV